MKNISFVVICLLLLFVGVFLTPQKVRAYGECSKYGIMASYDSLTGTCKCMSGYVFDDDFLGNSQCVSCSSKYGYGATSDYLGGGCKCMSGYVWGKDLFGKTACVSADTVCHDKYGYNSRYDSISSSCECSYGYVFGKDSIGNTQCVSPDSLCTSQLGYNARYNTLYDRCECRYGYVIDNGRCTDGDGVCHSKHGYHSSYNDTDTTCECDSGYTLNDSSQCVEKQNNVYFTLKELDTDNRKAIVKSDYDYSYYLITYNSGCYASSFRRYLNDKIVINLGTDFDLDTWDKIVLQYDDETCDITRKEYANSSTTLEPEEETSDYFIPEPVISTPVPVIKNSVTPTSPPIIKAKEESPKIDPAKKVVVETPVSEKLNTPKKDTKSEVKPSLFTKVFESAKNFFWNIFK